MQIHATKKLLDALPFSVEEIPEEEAQSLYSWHANLLTINRRKTVVLMNDSSRYIIVLHGMKVKDFKRFDKLVQEAIRQVFKAERISGEVIEKYIEAAGSITFHKTKNRSMTARLKQACDHVWVYEDELTTAELVNIQVGKRASRFLVGDGSYPYEALFKALGTLTDESIFSSDVAVLDVSLALFTHTISRKLMVPLNTTFQDLHKVLQIAFNWQDSHLHEFYLFDESEAAQPTPGQMVRPKINIVMDEEAFEYGSPGVEMKLEEGLTLADFIPPHMFMKYVYDFGDYWEHEIIVEEILTNQSISSPVCVELAGIAPPEDCGGEPGFDDFLEIINQPTHPEHEEMKRWGRLQGYEKVDLDIINRLLKKW